MKPFAPSATIASATIRQGGWQRLAEVGLISLVFLVFGGDLAPHVNEPHYLCRFKHFWQPDWAAGDLFLESPDAHYFVVISLGWLTKFLSLSATAWTLRIAVWLALAWAWQRLSFRLVPQNWCAPLAAAIWALAIEQGNLAGEWVIGGFESKCVAYVFVLLALYEIVDNLWNRVWIMLGCASAFHVLVGGWSVVVALFVWVLLRMGGWGRPKEAPSALPLGAALRSDPSHPCEAKPSAPPPFRAMLPGLAAGGVISLLGLVPSLTLNSGTPPEVVAEANYIYTFVRLPHHLALLHMDGRWLLERAGRHGVVFATWVLLALRLRWQRPESMNAPLWCMIYFAIGALALAVCGYAIELALWNYPYTAAKWQRFYWYRLNDVVGAALAAWLLVDWIVALLVRTCFESRVPLAPPVLSLARLEHWHSQWHPNSPRIGISKHVLTRKSWGMVILGAVLAVVGVRMAQIAYHRIEAPVAPADRKMFNYADWVDVCEWCDVNTPSVATFFVPRESHSFKWRTGRPEVVTRKDMPQDAASMVEWRKRMDDVFHPRFGTSSGWLASPNLQRITELAHRYDAEFIVLETQESLNLPLIYENDIYRVYDLRSLKNRKPPNSTSDARLD